jgi:hypothetical protein
MKLPIKAVQQCQVLVGNGQKMIFEGMVQELTMQVNDQNITISTYLLPVCGS